MPLSRYEIERGANLQSGTRLKALTGEREGAGFRKDRQNDPAIEGFTRIVWGYHGLACNCTWPWPDFDNDVIFLRCDRANDSVDNARIV